MCIRDSVGMWVSVGVIMGVPVVITRAVRVLVPVFVAMAMLMAVDMFMMAGINTRRLLAGQSASAFGTH